MESGSAGPDPVPALPSSLPLALILLQGCDRGLWGEQEVQGGAGGVELSPFLIPDSHSLLDLGSGMSCHTREGGESTTLPFGSSQIPPTRAAEGPHPPLRQHKPFPSKHQLPRLGGSRALIPGKGHRAHPARLQTPTQPQVTPPRSARRWGTGTGPSWRVTASILT